MRNASVPTLGSPLKGCDSVLWDMPSEINASGSVDTRHTLLCYTCKRKCFLKNINYSHANIVRLYKWSAYLEG